MTYAGSLASDAPTDYSGQFKRDVRQARKRGKDMDKLKTLLGLLIYEKPLPATYLDHPLKGGLSGVHGAHIEPTGGDL